MRVRLVAVASFVLLASCAAVLGLPDPTLDDTIPIGGGSSSGNTASSSGSSGGDGSPDDASKDGTITDGPPGDAPSGVLCAQQTTWGNIVPLGGVNDASSHETDPYLLPGENVMMFAVTPTNGGNLESMLYLAFRDASTEPFGNVLPFFTDRGPATAPCLADDFSVNYFTEVNATATAKMYAMRRDAGGALSAEQMGVGPPVARPYCRTLVGDASIMYFHIELGLAPTNTASLQRAEAGSAADTWSFSPLNISDAAVVSSPVVRPDELEIFFAEKVDSAAATPTRIMTSRRASTAAPWPAATPIAELNTSGSNVPGWLSRDGCRLYFASTRTNNTYDLYMAARPAQ